MEIITITVHSWGKYKGRGDVRQHSWFRMSNRIMEDADLFHLDLNEMCVWFYILSQCSIKGKDVAMLNPIHANHACRIPKKVFASGIRKLQQLQMITVAGTLAVRERDAVVPLQDKTRQDNTRQDTVSFENDHLPNLVQIWNSNCGEDLPKVKKSNAQRNKVCSSRMKDFSETEWVEIVKRIGASGFCCGKNDRGWRATFDWLLKPDTPLKVLEGKYDGGGNKKSLVDILKEAGHVDE